MVNSIVNWKCPIKIYSKIKILKFISGVYPCSSRWVHISTDMYWYTYSWCNSVSLEVICFMLWKLSLILWTCPHDLHRRKCYYSIYNSLNLWIIIATSISNLESCASNILHHILPQVFLPYLVSGIQTKWTLTFLALSLKLIYFHVYFFLFLCVLFWIVSSASFSV